jgi:rod shape-determining protein MreC
MIVNNNEKQNLVFVSSANSFTGSFFERFDKITRYWNLGEVNEELARDNKRLLEQLPNVRFNETIDTILIVDSLYQQQYEYIPALVVNNSVNRYNNYLTLNRGNKHGITSNSGVINGSGIVGIVQKTSTNYAAVMSILHRSTKISAKLKKGDYFGSLTWKGENAQEMNLEAIPKHAEVEIGDTITTSGFSSMFPKGLMIGIVESADLVNGSNFYDIKIKLSCDMNNISHVFIVTNLMREEQETLEAATENNE